jgi:mannose-6-phosphate isomerase
MMRISPALQAYAWGTTTDIPALLGLEPTDQPVAEAWWGAHAAAPSTVLGESRSLVEVIAVNPQEVLGSQVAQRWGGVLPYLLKVLAIRAPLSLQVHPTLARAQAGFAAQAGLAPSEPRDFPDALHKPEMILALTPMKVLAGLRPTEDLDADLAALGAVSDHPVRRALATGYAAYLSSVLGDEAGDDLLPALAHAAGSRSLAWASNALVHFPHDRGALVALALNPVELAPGESVFTGPGILHSYQEGVGVEIMANSDNVIRAGLTPKRINVPLLLECVDPVPSLPPKPTAQVMDAATVLSVPAEEFSLTVVDGGGWSGEASPRIVLAIADSAVVSTAKETVELSPGEAVFVPASDGRVSVTSPGMAVVAGPSVA